MSALAVGQVRFKAGVGRLVVQSIEDGCFAKVFWLLHSEGPGYDAGDVRCFDGPGWVVEQAAKG